MSSPGGFVAAETRPERHGAARWQLTDLIDVAALQDIQDTFAKVFGLPTVIVDPTGRNITNITHRVSILRGPDADLAGGRRALHGVRSARDGAGGAHEPSGDLQVLERAV